ncbi:hypothetical protein M1M98_02920, partial [Thermodesulfovibrionales bacterium]|nr:hypothetical protein [Thermodesulfovibrionales bacterium]
MNFKSDNRSNYDRRAMATQLRERLNFGKVPSVLEVPYLIEFQKRSFNRFLQKDIPDDKRSNEGLQAAFSSVFPIVNYNETASIEFISYKLGEPKTTPKECLFKGVTYTSPLRIKVRLNLWG